MTTTTFGPPGTPGTPGTPAPPSMPTIPQQLTTDAKALADFFAQWSNDLNRTSGYMETDAKQARVMTKTLRDRLNTQKKSANTIKDYFQISRKIKDLEDVALENMKQQQIISDQILENQRNGIENNEELQTQLKKLNQEYKGLEKSLENQDKLQEKIKRNNKAIQAGLWAKEKFKAGGKKGLDFVKDTTGLDFSSLGGLIGSAIAEGFRAASMGMQVQATRVLKTWTTFDDLREKAASFGAFNIKDMLGNVKEGMQDTGAVRMKAMRYGLNNETALNLMNKLVMVKNHARTSLAEVQKEGAISAMQMATVFQTSTEEIADLYLSLSQKLDRPFSSIRNDIASVASIFDEMNKKTKNLSISNQEFARSVFDSYKTLENYNVRLAHVAGMTELFYKNSKKLGNSVKQSTANAQTFVGLFTGASNNIPEWMRYVIGESLVKELNIGKIRAAFQRELKTSGSERAEDLLARRIDEKLTQMKILGSKDGEKSGQYLQLSNIMQDAVKGNISGYDTIRLVEEKMRGSKEYGAQMFNVLKDLGVNYKHGTTLLQQQLNLSYGEAYDLQRLLREGKGAEFAKKLEEYQKTSEKRDPNKNLAKIADSISHIQAGASGGIMGMVKSMLYGIIEKIPKVLVWIWDTTKAILAFSQTDKYAKKYQDDVSQVLELRAKRRTINAQIDAMEEDAKHTGSYDKQKHAELVKQASILANKEQELIKELPVEVKTSGWLSKVGALDLGSNKKINAQMINAKQKAEEIVKGEQREIESGYVMNPKVQQAIMSIAKKEGGGDLVKTQKIMKRLIDGYITHVQRAKDLLGGDILTTDQLTNQMEMSDAYIEKITKNYKLEEKDKIAIKNTSIGGTTQYTVGSYVKGVNKDKSGTTEDAVKGWSNLTGFGKTMGIKTIDNEKAVAQLHDFYIAQRDAGRIATGTTFDQFTKNLKIEISQISSFEQNPNNPSEILIHMSDKRTVHANVSKAPDLAQSSSKTLGGVQQR